jgi:hypothetical protein
MAASAMKLAAMSISKLMAASVANVEISASISMAKIMA